MASASGLYIVDTTGEQFRWMSSEGRYASTSSRTRVTAEQLREIRNLRISALDYMTQLVQSHEQQRQSGQSVDTRVYPSSSQSGQQSLASYPSQTPTPRPTDHVQPYPPPGQGVDPGYQYQQYQHYQEQQYPEQQYQNSQYQYPQYQDQQQQSQNYSLERPGHLSHPSISSHTSSYSSYSAQSAQETQGSAASYGSSPPTNYGSPYAPRSPTEYNNQKDSKRAKGSYNHPSGSRSTGTSSSQGTTTVEPSQGAGSSNTLDNPTGLSDQVAGLTLHDEHMRVVQGIDPNTHVAYNNSYGPAPRITDPVLFQEGVQSKVIISATLGEAEEFTPEYRVRKQPRKFFVLGKVFKILWSEPAGDGNDSFHPTEYTRDSKFGENIFSKVRRFVVIRPEESYCSAIPIVSYTRQGVSKRHTKKSDCAIIYTGKTPPSPLPEERPIPGESPMRSEAIRVDPDERGGQLLPSSRVNFGKVYTIEHNVKVKSFGMVNRDSIRDLVYQFRCVWAEMFGTPMPSSVLPGPSNSGQYNSRAELRAAMQDPRGSTGSVNSQALSTQSQKSRSSRRSESSDRDNDGKGGKDRKDRRGKK